MSFCTIEDIDKEKSFSTSLTAKAGGMGSSFECQTKGVSKGDNFPGGIGVQLAGVVLLPAYAAVFLSNAIGVWQNPFMSWPSLKQNTP